MGISRSSSTTTSLPSFRKCSYLVINEQINYNVFLLVGWLINGPFGGLNSLNCREVTLPRSTSEHSLVWDYALSLPWGYCFHESRTSDSTQAFVKYCQILWTRPHRGRVTIVSYTGSFKIQMLQINCIDDQPVNMGHPEIKNNSEFQVDWQNNRSMLVKH